MNEEQVKIMIAEDFDNLINERLDSAIIFKYINNLEKENLKLKDNWSKLKQYLLGGVSSDNYIIIENSMLSKMRELEKSDS